MPLCIVGMHRSGTSMVARLLNICGLYLGEDKDIMQPQADNPEGFWENNLFVEINDKILSSNGYGWDYPPKENNFKFQDISEEIKLKAKTIINAMNSRTPWGWKDPRNSLNLLFWQELIPDLKVIVCLRNPLEVAMSLKKRANNSTAFSFNLWFLYNKMILDSFEKERMIITHYDSFFINPAYEIKRLLKFSGLEINDEKISNACSGILKKLRHHILEESDLINVGASKEILELYKEMCNEAGPVFNHLNIVKNMDNNDLSHTIRLLEQLISKYQDYALAYNDLGVLSYQIGEKSKAIKYYEKAVSIEPQNLLFQKNLADFYYIELKRFDDALKIYQKLIVDNPNDIETLLSIAHIYTTLNNYKEALSFYCRVLEIDPKNAIALERKNLLLTVIDEHSFFTEIMKSDWNKRAIEDAVYYVHSTKKGQSEEEFDASGKESVKRFIEDDLLRIAGGKRPEEMEVLEIGCGIGRMTKHMSRIFGKVHAIDISGEMIARARERLKGISNIFLYETNGKDLSIFSDNKFDFIFSFIVFQHIPSKEIIMNYIREAHRILKPESIFKFQVQGCTDPEWLKQKKDTWHGVTITYDEIKGISDNLGFNIEDHNGEGTQYSWYTLRKKEKQIPFTFNFSEPIKESNLKFVSGLTSIVIPVFNKVEYTKKCLEAIRRNTPEGRYEIIIIDNASTDETANFLKGMENDIKLITNMRNLGFTPASNQGAKIASGEYVLFLNNDTEPQKGWLESMIELMQYDPQIGITGSKLIYPDGRLQEAGGVIFSDGSGWNFGRFDNPFKPIYNYVREVDYVSGASLLIRHSLLKQLNYFDEQYSPGYYEDTDLCFGARALGYKVMYCPFSIVIHYEGVSSGTDINSGMKKYQVINREKFINKWRKELKKQYFPEKKNVIKASERNIKGNIIIIDPFMPKFDRASGSLRLFSILKILKDLKYHITYIARNGYGQQQYERILNFMGIEVYSIESEKVKKLGVNSDTIKANINKILLERHYDIAILSFYEIAIQYLDIIRKLSPDTKILIDTVDIHFIREIRMAEINNDKKLLRKAYRTKNEELSIYRRADAVITVTEKDWEHIAKYLSDLKHYVIPNIHEISEETLDNKDRKGLVFVGNFNHPPNADAVLFFVKDIYPLIKRKINDITFSIIGNNPPEEILKLNNGKDIIVTGYVPSISPYLSTAKVSVAPLRYGAGMKGKIGEAMAHGLPVVTTSIGAEGMGIVDGETALIADNPEEFANKVYQLYTDDIMWMKISESGKNLIKDNYSKEKVSKIIIEMLNDINERKTCSVSYSTEKKITKGLTSIIILTFNEIKYSKECYESIKKYTPEPHEIIFIDNGSTDGTVKWLRQVASENKNIKLIENKTNLGFAKGCNQGIKIASGEYLLLLNNDVVVTEGWLSGMLDCIKREEAIGIVGPMTNNISGIQRISDYNNVSTENINDYAKAFYEKNKNRMIPVRRVAGFCMFFRHSLIQEIGMLDEDFGSGNYEDDDFCLRAVLSGYKNYIAGDIFIYHYGSRSFKGNGIDYRKAMEKNQKIFSNKWSVNSGNRDLSLLRFIEKADILAQKGKIEDSIREYIKAIQIAPDDVRSYYAFAEMLINEKKYNDALDVLGQSPVQDDLKLIFLKAKCCEGLKEISKAEEYIETILSKDKFNIYALNLKGQIAYEKGNIIESEKLFKIAIEINPSYGEPFTNLGVLKWAEGKFEEALNLTERGFILSPNDNDISSIYHSIASNLSEYLRCEKVFREAKSLYPNNRKLTFLLIDMLIKQNKNEEALIYIQESITSFGKDDGIIDAAIEVRKRIDEENKIKRLDSTEVLQKNKKTISLCMIVKNEEENLPACLNSVRDIIDEIVIVDTGSNDRTKDIGKIYGAEIYDFKWTGDFSEARNYSLSKASCDWILILDADEIISTIDHNRIKDLFKNIKQNIAYSFTTRNYVNISNISGWISNGSIYSKEEKGKGWFPGEKVRLFPNRKGIKFYNKVHELVEPSLKKAGIKIKHCDVPIHHYGKLNDTHVKEKGEEYYQLGFQKIEDNIEDPKAIYELAIQAGELDRYNEAIELWKKLLKKNSSLPDNILLKAYINMGHAYFHLEMYEEARNVSRKAYLISSNSQDAIMNYSLSEVWVGDVDNAISALKKLLKNNPDYPQAVGLLGIAYLIKGEDKEGFECLAKIKKKGYNCSKFIHEHAKILIKTGRQEQANLIVKKAVDREILIKETTNFHAEMQQCIK